MGTRAAIYARISRDRVGAGLGVERQRDDCRELAERLAVTVTAVHTDNDLSAYSGKPRLGYRALLDAIGAGTIDLVLCWHTDRLHRSPTELEEWIAVCEPRSVAVHTVKAGPLDLASPSGRMVARQLGAVARYEVEHMIERQQAAKKQAAAAGKYRGGRRPYGYEADGVTVRPTEALVVADLTNRILIGQSLHSVAADLNDAGHRTSTGKRWDSRGVRRLAMRARNAGLVETESDREAAEAEWPAIVDRDTWRAVCALLEDPGRKPPAKVLRERFLGSGVYVCGQCGETMLSATTMGAGKRNRPAYRCRAGYHVTRMAEPVDDLVSRVIVERLSRPDAHLLLAGPEPAVDVPALQDQANTLRGRLDEASRLFAAGTIDGGQLAITTETVRAQLSEVNRALASRVAGTPLDGVAGEDDVQAAWNAVSVGRKKAIIDALLTVTLVKAPRGRQPDGSYFDPSSVVIDWKQAASTR